MADELEPRVRRALAHVAPSAAADADLAEALSTAERSPPAVARRPFWIGGAVAAAIIAAVGVVALRREHGDGRAAQVTASAPLDGRTIRVHVDSGGNVVLDDLRGAPRVRVELGGTPTRASDGLDVLGRALAELAAGEPRAENGTSTVALEFEPSGDAKWIWEQWIMQVATKPSVRIDRIRFGMEGRDEPAIEQLLPSDRGMDAGRAADAEAITVTLTSSAGTDGISVVGGGRVQISMEESAVSGRMTFNSSRSSTDPDRTELAQLMSSLIPKLQYAAKDRRVAGQIRTPPPSGSKVPYEVVIAVLRAFREAGIDDVRFEGAATPMPQESTSSR